MFDMNAQSSRGLLESLALFVPPEHHVFAEEAVEGCPKVGHTPAAMNKGTEKWWLVGIGLLLSRRPRRFLIS
jgi:hypothetical protein